MSPSRNTINEQAKRGHIFASVMEGLVTVAWQAAYHGFGHAEVDVSSTITNNLRFPGQYFDAETNLHYNWNRYYDPRTGRYLTPDPIGLEGGIDPYVYVENSPVNWIDPDGLEVMVCSRPVSGGPLRTAGGKHVYLHNTLTRENLGTSGAYGKGEQARETPERDKCAIVKDSKGREKEIMEEMRRIRNEGPYFPGIWDCHYKAQKTLESQGLKYPADLVGGRLYKRTIETSAPYMMGR